MSQTTWFCKTTVRQIKIKISPKPHQKSSTTTSLQTLTPPSLSKIEQKYARSPKVFYPPDGVSPFFVWGDFHVRSRFARSTIPEEKWGTTRSLFILRIV